MRMRYDVFSHRNIGVDEVGAILLVLQLHLMIRCMTFLVCLYLDLLIHLAIASLPFVLTIKPDPGNKFSDLSRY